MMRAIGVESGEKDAKKLMDSVRSFTDKAGVFAQAFSPRAIISERQLLLAHKLAERAFAEKRNIAKTLEGEALVRAAATRKIGDAIGKVGAKGGEFILLTDAEGKMLEALLKAIGGKKVPLKLAGEKAANLYGVKQVAGYSLEELVLEKMAMLEAEK